MHHINSLKKGEKALRSPEHEIGARKEIHSVFLIPSRKEGRQLSFNPALNQIAHSICDPFGEIIRFVRIPIRVCLTFVTYLE